MFLTIFYRLGLINSKKVFKSSCWSLVARVLMKYSRISFCRSSSISMCYIDEFILSNFSYYKVYSAPRLVIRDATSPKTIALSSALIMRKILITAISGLFTGPSSLLPWIMMA